MTEELTRAASAKKTTAAKKKTTAAKKKPAAAKKKTTAKKTTTKKTTTAQPKLTKAEIELIKQYRKCDATEKKLIQKAVETLSAGNALESITSLFKK